MRDTYVHPDLGEAFAQVVNQARALTDAEADDLQEVYEARWNGRVDRASGRVHRALERAGYSRNGDTDPAGAWIYLDELCGIVGGAADVASAVLARDAYLISPGDFRLLTAWWVDAGLTLPAGTATGFAPANRAHAVTRRPWFRAACAVLLIAALAVAGVRFGLAYIGAPISRASLALTGVSVAAAVVGLIFWWRTRRGGAR